MNPLKRIDYSHGDTALTGWLVHPAGKPRAAGRGAQRYGARADRQSWAAMLYVFDEVFAQT